MRGRLVTSIHTRRLGTSCESREVPQVNFQVLRLTVATHVQGVGSVQDHKDDAAPHQAGNRTDQLRAACGGLSAVCVDKLASTLLG